MRQQFASAGVARVVSPLAEEDVLTGGKCDGIHSPIERMGVSASMNAHAAKIGPKSGFHLATDSTLQALTATACPLDGRFHIGSHFSFAFTLPGQQHHPLHVTVAVVSLHHQYGALAGRDL